MIQVDNFVGVRGLEILYDSLILKTMNSCYTMMFKYYRLSKLVKR